MQDAAGRKKEEGKTSEKEECVCNEGIQYDFIVFFYFVVVAIFIVIFNVRGEKPAKHKND